MIEEIVAIRKEKKVKRSDMLEHLGITLTTLSRYESGKRDMPLSVFEKYVGFLDHYVALVRKNK